MRVRWAYDVALKVAGWQWLDQHRAWALVLLLTDGYVL